VRILMRDGKWLVMRDGKWLVQSGERPERHNDGPADQPSSE
jgi:hypothetical protein